MQNHTHKIPGRYSVYIVAGITLTFVFVEAGVSVVTAISFLVFSSSTAQATVVGVLIEVPVMLSVVSVVNRTNHWFVDGNRVNLSSG